MRGLRTVGLRLTCERSSRSRGSPLARQQAPRRPPRERIRADPERRTTVVIGKFHRVRSVVLNADWALNREGRYRALAPKVSQAAGSPVCMPMVNHFWRDADEPWVKVSGETRPRVALDPIVTDGRVRQLGRYAPAKSSSAVVCEIENRFFTDALWGCNLSYVLSLEMGPLARARVTASEEVQALTSWADFRRYCRGVERPCDKQPGCDIQHAGDP